MQRMFPHPRSRHLVVFVLILLAALTITNYLTTRNVARNRDVINAVCTSSNQQIRAIRTVLENSIAAAKRGEMLAPQFRAQYEQSIRLNRRYLRTLFVIHHC